MSNPYASPQGPVVAPDSALSLPRQYGGIGRLSFLGLGIGLIFVNVLAAVLAEVFDASEFVELIGLPLMIAGFALVYFRMKNIGVNPWWCLAFVVPILNLLILIRCLIMPEGYWDTKQLDAVGKLATYVACAVFVLLVAYVAILLLG